MTNITEELLLLPKDEKLKKLIDEVIQQYPEQKQIKIVQEFLALFPVREQFDVSSKLEIALGDIPWVQVGECTEENSERIIFETLPQNFETQNFHFLNNLNKFAEQFYGGGSLNPDTAGTLAFSSKEQKFRGTIQVHWKDDHLTLSGAQIQSSETPSNFYSQLHENPDPAMSMLQTAVEELTTALHEIFQQQTAPALSQEAWEYVWAQPKQKIEDNNQERLREKQRVEAENAPYRERAEKLYEFFDSTVEQLRPQLTTQLDDEVFQDWQDKSATLRENAVRHLAGWLRFFPEDVNVENQALKQYLADFIQNAQIGHNRTEAHSPDSHPAERVQKLARGNARDLIDYLRMNPEQTYLSCTLVNPKSETTQKYGTGWAGDTCYVFALEKFAAQSLVFTGDVDQATNEGPVEKRAMFVKDALLISALLNYKNTIIDETKVNTSYDELLFFRTVDFETDPSEKIVLNNISE